MFINIFLIVKEKEACFVKTITNADFRERIHIHHPNNEHKGAWLPAPPLPDVDAFVLIYIVEYVVNYSNIKILWFYCLLSSIFRQEKHLKSELGDFAAL